MRVQVVEGQDHPACFRIAPVEQVANSLRPVGLATAFRDLCLSPSRKRLAKQKDVGRSIGRPYGGSGLRLFGSYLGSVQSADRPDRSRGSADNQLPKEPVGDSLREQKEKRVQRDTREAPRRRWKSIATDGAQLDAERVFQRRAEP